MPLLALKNARAAAENGYRTLAALGREEAQQRERTIHRWTYPTLPVGRLLANRRYPGTGLTAEQWPCVDPIGTSGV